MRASSSDNGCICNATPTPKESCQMTGGRGWRPCRVGCGVRPTDQLHAEPPEPPFNADCERRCRTGLLTPNAGTAGYWVRARPLSLGAARSRPAVSPHRPLCASVCLACGLRSPLTSAAGRVGWRAGAGGRSAGPFHWQHHRSHDGGGETGGIQTSVLLGAVAARADGDLGSEIFAGETETSMPNAVDRETSRTSLSC